MISMRSIVLLLLLFAPFTHAVDQSPQDAAKELIGKTVLLRARNAEDKLAFDAQGNPTGKFISGPFALSAIEIRKAHISGHSLRLEGNRALLAYPPDVPVGSIDKVIPLGLNKEKVEMEIAFDPSHADTLQATLLKIFARSVTEALDSQTAEERRSSLETLAAFIAPEAAQPVKPQPGSVTSSGVYATGTGTLAPRVIHSVDPELTPDARRKHIGGTCTVSIVLDKEGFPTHARIQKSLEAGLDQNAVLAVSQFRFTPAMFEGKPLAVRIDIQVTFTPN